MYSTNVKTIAVSSPLDISLRHLSCIKEYFLDVDGEISYEITHVLRDCSVFFGPFLSVTKLLSNFGLCNCNRFPNRVEWKEIDGILVEKIYFVRVNRRAVRRNVHWISYKSDRDNWILRACMCSSMWFSCSFLTLCHDYGYLTLECASIRSHELEQINRIDSSVRPFHAIRHCVRLQLFAFSLVPLCRISGMIMDIVPLFQSHRLDFIQYALIISQLLGISDNEANWLRNRIERNNLVSKVICQRWVNPTHLFFYTTQYITLLFYGNFSLTFG